MRAGAHAVLGQGVRPAAGGAETSVCGIKMDREVAAPLELRAVVRGMEVSRRVPQRRCMERRAG
jgi:hypothetical protein